MKKLRTRILGAALAVALAFSAGIDFSAVLGGISAFAEESTDQPIVIAPQEDINRDEELPAFEEPVYTAMFSFPAEMRGVYVTPTVDYAAENSTEAVADEVETLLDNAESNRLNAVIINTDCNGEMLYNCDLNETLGEDVITALVDGARDRGMYVYMNFSIDAVLTSLEDMTLQEKIDFLALRVHTFTVKYPVDGIILDGYYSTKTNLSLHDYVENGSGIGFENWLLDNGAYVFALASDAVRKTNNTVPVGISINDVWANYENNEKGSATSVKFEALTDGYADTVDYIQKGYADFIMLKAEGSRSSSSEPFGEITKWWNDIADEAGIPLFVHHMNEYICTDTEGWGSPDELVKQVIDASELSSYGGSAFDSLSALVTNSMESTTALTKHYDDTIDLEGLNSELEMTLPKKTTFKTEEPTVIFAGSFDPNFPVYYQGKEIVLNEAGRFYFTEDLDVGVNTFKFQNKAKVITYKITRTVNILKSVSPSDGTMYVDGESTIAISAIAYKGSEITAKINGKSIPLKEVESQLDELDPNSYYTKYVGRYTAPQGKKGEEINLGSIEFYGVYHTKTGDMTESRTGSSIIINALAEVANDFTGSILMVNNDNTMVYNAKSTDTAPTPDMARLPAGTLDYIINTVTYSGTDYYITNSGKRIRTNAVSILENKPLGTNPISVNSVYKDGTDTVIKLKTSVKIPFSVSYNGVNYSDGDNGSYYISSFNSDGITITFSYITSISAGDITFPESSVFTSGTWSAVDTGDIKSARLSLKFRQSGIYSGIKATYDSDDNLTLCFNGCRSSVNGATIVIDPGHGYTGGNFDPGAIGHIKEQEANLAVAKYLESILTAEGANVIRLKTESENYDTDQRASIARQYSPDLFIAVHCNAAANEKATGVEAYYFTPFSQPLADSVSASMGSYLYNSVDNGGLGDRGEKYNYFFVTQQQEFPSILVECGFVTNYTEAMALANAKHQKGIANAIAEGIKKYFAKCSYSCFGEGVGSVSGQEIQLPAESSQPEQPSEPEQSIETTAPAPNDDYDEDDPYYQYFGVQ